MDQLNLLAASVAEEFASVIKEWHDEDIECGTCGRMFAEEYFPKELQPRHLLWMCKKIEKHQDDWPATKLHRWIGFIQCAMMANNMVVPMADLFGAIRIVDKGKTAFSESTDQDLNDHNDPNNPFRLDIGGES